MKVNLVAWGTLVILELSIVCIGMQNTVHPKTSIGLGTTVIGAQVSAVQCGDTTIEATADSGGPNQEMAFAQCIPAANHLVTDCKVYTGAVASGNLNCAIYTINGGNGIGTLICSGTQVTPAPNTWNVITMSGCGTLTSGTTYYVTFNMSVSSTNTQYKSSGSGWFRANACCTFDTGQTFAALSRTYSMYLDLN